MKKGVGLYKPHVAKPKKSKLAVVKNTSSKIKQRSQSIAPKLEFSNTQDDPIEIEEAKEEGSVQRENKTLLRMNPKNKIAQQHLREVISLMTFQNLKKAIFQLVKAPFGKLL